MTNDEKLIRAIFGDNPTCEYHLLIPNLYEYTGKQEVGIIIDNKTYRVCGEHAHTFFSLGKK